MSTDDRLHGVTREILRHEDHHFVASSPSHSEEASRNCYLSTTHSILQVVTMPVNPDLQKERDHASIALDRLTWMLDGGRDRTQRRKQLEALIARDPTGIFDNSNNSYLHRTDRHVRALAKHVRLVELCRKLNIASEAGGDIIQSKDFPLLLAAIADDLPTSLHWIMFIPNIVSLCDEEQQKQWLPVRAQAAEAQGRLG
jgi:hypothetical protein